MFSNSFFASSNQPKASCPSIERCKSPPRSCEEWMLLENLDQWPNTAPGEVQTGPDPNSVVGSFDDIKEDLRTHSLWGAEVFEGTEKKVQRLEDTLSGLAVRFRCDSTAQESVPGELTDIRDKTFLTEYHDTDLLSLQRLGNKQEHSFNDGSGGLTLKSLVYPGLSEGSSTLPLPGTLKPLHLLDLVTKCTSLPSYITRSWQKVFFSDSSCSLLQNTFWYVWLTYFKTRPKPEDLSRLFTTISENYISLFHMLEQNHKDEVFIYLPGCLAQAVYSAFCHSFPESNKTFNSDDFLTYLTNLTSKWITGVSSPAESWKSWPRYLLNPHHSVSAEVVTSSTKFPAAHAPFSEKDVMRLSIQDKSRTVRICSTRTHTATGGRSRDSCSAVSRVKHTQNVTEDEGVGVGKGPVFECVSFSLAGKSPLLQHYLVTHGLAEAREGTPGPVMGRTQISQLPAPTVTYTQLLKSSEAASKQRYDTFMRDLAVKDQEITAARKKYNALLRASDRRNEKVLQHRYQVAIMAERIMNKYTCRSTPIKLAQTTTSPPQ